MWTRMICEVLEIIKQSGAPSKACELEERRYWYLCKVGRWATD